MAKLRIEMPGPMLGWIAVVLLGALALPACRSSATSPDTGSGGGAQTGAAGGGGGPGGSPSGGSSGSPCTFAMTGQQTSSGPCWVTVATGILEKNTETRFAMSSSDDGVSPGFTVATTLSHATDFHVGRYDATNIVSSGASSMVPGQLAGWFESFKHQNMRDQGTFSLVVTDIGTPLSVPPGIALTGITGWRGEHGTFDLTLTPLASTTGQVTTGQVLIHATF